MSEAIKESFGNYMLCAVVGGMLEYISPRDARKTIRVIVVALLLIVTLSPILKIEWNTDFLNEVTYDDTAEYEGLLHIQNLMEKEIRGKMQEIIINAGVKEYEIYITTEIDEENNTVYLHKVKIELGTEYYHKAEYIKNNAPEDYRSVVEVGVKK